MPSFQFCVAVKHTDWLYSVTMASVAPIGDQLIVRTAADQVELKKFLTHPAYLFAASFIYFLTSDSSSVHCVLPAVYHCSPQPIPHLLRPMSQQPLVIAGVTRNICQGLSKLYINTFLFWLLFRELILCICFQDVKKKSSEVAKLVEVEC